MKIRLKRWPIRDKQTDDSGGSGGPAAIELPESEDLLAAGAAAALEAAGSTAAEDDAGSQEGTTAPTTPAAGTEASDEQELFIGEAAAPNDVEAAPSWLKRLRKRVKEQAEQLANLGAGRAPAPTKVVVGPKPTIESFNYDTDKYTAALDKWHDDRAKAERAEQQARDQQTQEERAWSTKVASHEAKGKALPFKDYDDCAAAAEAELSPVQRAIIVKGASNSALVMYALGRNIQKAEELAALTDPIEFAFAVAEFQKGLSMKPRTPKTTPERTVSSGAPASAVLSGEDKKLNDLRDEAIRTGDMSKLMAHRRKVAEAAKRKP